MSKPVVFKFIRSDNKMFLMDGASWKITNITGIDNAEFTLFTQDLGIGDGTLVTGKKVDGRTVTVTANVMNKSNNEILRKNAISFFNPKYTYKLHVTYQGVTRWLNCELDGFSAVPKNVYKPVEIKVTTYSANPYFRSEDDYGKNIASVTPMFAFPYICPIDKGINCGVYNFAKEVNVNNDGDVETYCRVVINAKGTVTNPKIIKDGKYVKLLDTLITGDVVEIDLEKSTVTKNGINAINKTDKHSTFNNMQFETGDNTIGFTADDGDTYMDVTVYWNKLYLGV